MKNWKTTLSGILAAGIILATAKKWIDVDVAAFLGSAVAIFFGASATDADKKE